MHNYNVPVGRAHLERQMFLCLTIIIICTIFNESSVLCNYNVLIYRVLLLVLNLIYVNSIMEHAFVKCSIRYETFYYAVTKPHLQFELRFSYRRVDND